MQEQQIRLEVRGGIIELTEVNNTIQPTTVIITDYDNKPETTEEHNYCDVLNEPLWSVCLDDIKQTALEMGYTEEHINQLLNNDSEMHCLKRGVEEGLSSAWNNVVNTAVINAMEGLGFDLAKSFVIKVKNINQPVKIIVTDL